MDKTITLTCAHFGHFIRNILVVLFWTILFLQNHLKSLWQSYNEVLELCFRSFVPDWQISLLHMHDINLLFHDIPRGLHLTELLYCGNYWSPVN